MDPDDWLAEIIDCEKRNSALNIKDDEMGKKNETLPATDPQNDTPEKAKEEKSEMDICLDALNGLRRAGKKLSPTGRIKLANMVREYVAQ